MASFFYSCFIVCFVVCELIKDLFFHPIKTISTLLTKGFGELN